MAKEPKPIKKEKIDNADGSYTINEWYKTNRNGVAISYISSTYYSNEIHCTFIYKYNNPLQNWKCIKRIMTLDGKVLKAYYFSDTECQDYCNKKSIHIKLIHILARKKILRIILLS